MADDDFTDFTGVPAEAGARKAAPLAALWLTAPAKNSVELSLRECQMLDPFLEHDVAFGDEDAQGDGPRDDPGVMKARGDIAAFWSAHVSLARSLGPDGTYAQYVAACVREKMQPVKLSDHQK